MASILDEYEDSQNTRKSAQQHSRLPTANIGLTHSGRSPSSLEMLLWVVSTHWCYISSFFTLTLRCTWSPMAGFVNVRLEEEKPIFNKQRIDFTPPEKINHLSVCNNQLCMSLGKDTLLRQMTPLLLLLSSSFFGLLWLAPIGGSYSCLRVCWIYRIDLAKPDQPNQIELGRKDESKVHRLFLDPTGEETHIVYSIFYRLTD